MEKLRPRAKKLGKLVLAPGMKTICKPFPTRNKPGNPNRRCCHAVLRSRQDTRVAEIPVLTNGGNLAARIQNVPKIPRIAQTLQV